MASTAFYKGKHIVKREFINGIAVETYVEFENGLIYLKTYTYFESYSSKLIADLTGGERKDGESQ